LEVLLRLKWCDLAVLPVLGGEALEIGKIIGTDGSVRVSHRRQKISQCDITGHNLRKKAMHTQVFHILIMLKGQKIDLFYPKSGDRLEMLFARSVMYILDKCDRVFQPFLMQL